MAGMGVGEDELVEIGQTREELERIRGLPAPVSPVGHQLGLPLVVATADASASLPAHLSVLAIKCTTVFGVWAITRHHGAGVL